MEIKRLDYEDYTVYERIVIYQTNESWDTGTSYLVWKAESKDKWKTFDSDSTGKLFEILSGLIEKLTDDVAPNEETAIKTLGGWLVRVLSLRLNISEETKTRRNKLVRHLREEIERLKK